MSMNPQKSDCVAVLASHAADVRKRWSHALMRSSSIFEADRYEALKQVLEELKPSVLLLDLTLEGLGGIANLPLLRRLSAGTKIVLFHAKTDHHEGLLAIEAGACGYCHIDINVVLLKKTLDIVQNGGKRIMVLDEEETPSAGSEIGFDKLTLREREVAHLIAGGANNKEIARRLEITEATVKAHLTSIFRKIGVADRLRLAIFFRERLAIPLATDGS